MNTSTGPISAVGKHRGRRVGVLLGGLSNEREISLRTGKAIATALRSSGYDTVEIDAAHDLPERLRADRVEVVFNALHGTWGEDGRVQGLLDWMQIPYTGDGLRACLLSMDKAISKQLFRLRGVPVAADVVWHRGAPGTDPSTAECPFDGKVVVKPVAEGSSVGVTIVQSPEAFRPAVAEAFRVADRILVERFVEGVELSVVTFFNRPLGAVEIEPVRAFYDYEAKYGNAGTRYHVPPRVTGPALEACLDAGLRAHRALGCHGVTRTDVILGEAGPVVLEVNTLPGMTATSLVPKVAAAAGLSFEALVECMLDHAHCGLEADDAP
jgi:D-alanine-D-alanine ligase